MRTTLLVFALLAAASAIATEKSAGDLAYSHFWYDGGQKRPLAVDPELVGEVQVASGRAARSAGGVTHAPIKIRKRSLLQTRTSDGVPTTPVFRDSNSTGASMRALPGHVLVHFPAEWSDQQVRDWARRERVAIGERLDFGRNIYLVLSAPGLPALELANRLYETGDVVAAYPNWWQEMRKR